MVWSLVIIWLNVDGGFYKFKMEKMNLKCKSTLHIKVTIWYEDKY